MSIRDNILSHKPTTESLKTFGGTVYIREMAGREVASFQRWLTQHEDRNGIDISCELLVRTICDRQGTRQFQDDEAGLLADLPIQDIRRAYAVAERLNILDDQAIEDAEGNSVATPDLTQGSASHAS